MHIKWKTCNNWHHCHRTVGHR